jgi:hypothetical protein
MALGKWSEPEKFFNRHLKDPCLLLNDTVPFYVTCPDVEFFLQEWWHPVLA